MATTVEICVAVANEVTTRNSAAEYSVLLHAVNRVTTPRSDYEDMVANKVYCEVFPGPRTTTRGYRKLFPRTIQVFVAIFARLDGSGGQSLEDATITVAEEIENSLLTFDGAGFSRNEPVEQTAPPFIPQVLDDASILMTVIPITFHTQV